jgi:phage head maturation protease
MVRRGDYSGCSFEFWPDEYDIEERDGGKDVKITHKKFRAITALTIGMDPAYKQTSVNARELWENTPTGKREKEKESQMQREAMQREMQRRVEHLQRLADFDKRLESTTY